MFIPCRKKKKSNYARLFHAERQALNRVRFRRWLEMPFCLPTRRKKMRKRWRKQRHRERRPVGSAQCGAAQEPWKSRGRAVEEPRAEEPCATFCLGAPARFEELRRDVFMHGSAVLRAGGVVVAPGGSGLRRALPAGVVCGGW